MAGEGTSLGRAFVEIGVPVDATAASLQKIAVTSKATTTGMISGFAGVTAMMKSALPIMAAYAAVMKTIGIATTAIDAQREFNKELYQLWTLTDLSAQGIEDLGGQIRDLTYDYNVMAKAGTKAMYQIYSATFYGADATEIFEQGMKAAAAGVTDVMAAVDMTTTVLNAYNMEASESARVNDLLFTAVRFGKTTYGELAGQFGRLAGVAAPAGARLEEMAAAIATLTRQGIMTDWAVTSLRQTIMSMFRPTGALAKVIKDLGYETGRSLIQQNGFVGALKLVKERADETNTPLENLFTNVRAITAVLPLLTTASEGFALDIERMAVASGTMDVAFGKVAESWDYRIEVLKSQINDLSIGIGETLIPAVESFLKVLTSGSEGLEGWIKLLGPIGETISELSGTVSGLVVTMGAMAGIIWVVNKAWLLLAANPVVAGILLVGTALSMIVKEFEDIAEETQNATTALEKYLLTEAGITGKDPEIPTGARLSSSGPFGFGAAPGYESTEADFDRFFFHITESLSNFLVDLKSEQGFVSEDDVLSSLQLALKNIVDESSQYFWPEMAEAVATAFNRKLENIIRWSGPVFPPDIAGRFGGDIGTSAPTFGEAPSPFESFTAVPAGQTSISLPELLPDSKARNALYETYMALESLWASIQDGSITAAEGESKLEAYLGALAESEGMYESAVSFLDMMKSTEGLAPGTIDWMQGIVDSMADMIGASSGYAMETEALIKVFTGAADGSILQAQALDDLIGRYATLTGWVETLSDVEKEANSEIIQLIESIEELGITAEKAGDRMIDVAAGIASGIGGLISKFGGEGAAGIGNIATSGGGFISAIGAATAIGAGPIAGVAAVVAGLDVLGTLWKELVVNPADKAEEERRAKQEESYDTVLDSAIALADALWSLAESAESVARIQEGLAQLQVNIMSALLGFLWPLASVLDSINGLFVIQEETIKKETEARQKLLSNLNVPIGFPINRIRYGAGTPGEAVTFNESEVGSESEEAVKEILTWWEEAMEPYRNEILGMIQPIADFRDAMQQLATDLIPTMMTIIGPILDTFGWTLGELSTWMKDVFKPDFERFGEGFAAFWTEEVDPFWQEEMGPQVAEWLQRIYDWFEPILEFLSGPVWDWLSTDVWDAVKPYVDEILQMFEELGQWVAANWDTIKVTLLDNLKTWLGNLVTSIQLAAEWVLDLLGLESPWASGNQSGPSEDFWNNVLDPDSPGYTPPETPSTTPEPTGPGGLTAGEIAAIIAAHGGFGGVMGSTGEWVPYSTWNGIPVEQLGKGGIATSPMPAIVGDVPEAIIPLNQLASMLSMQPQAAGMTGFGGFGGGGGVGSTSATININLSQDRLAQIMLRKMTSANVNDNGVGFAPIRVG